MRDDRSAHPSWTKGPPRAWTVQRPPWYTPQLMLSAASVPSTPARAQRPSPPPQSSSAPATPARAQDPLSRPPPPLPNTAPPSSRLPLPEDDKPFRVYNTPRPPPRSHPETTVRFVLISDTHGEIPADVPDGDVLLHAGDLSKWGKGSVEGVRRTVEWMVGLSHRWKIFIAGNNDSALDPHLPTHLQPHPPSSLSSIQTLLSDPHILAAGITYLNNSGLTFQVRPGGREWTVYGCPWTPRHEHGALAFTYTPDRGPEKLADIYAGIDVLLTHGPPLCTGSCSLDSVSGGKHVGCPSLASAVSRTQPFMHVFGHIHGGRGVQTHKGERERWRVDVNACYADKERRKTEAWEYRGPIVVDWREDLMEGRSGPSIRTGVGEEAGGSRSESAEMGGVERALERVELAAR